MGLITDNAFNYYAGSQYFVGDGSTASYTVNLSPQPTVFTQFYVYINDELQSEGTYSYSNPTLTFLSAPEANDQIVIALKDKKYGDYRYTSMNDIVTNFMVAYVGDGKIINRAKRRDVVFHTKILQDDDFNYQFDSNDELATSSPVTSDRFKNLDSQNLSGSYNNDDYFYNLDYPAEKLIESGKRYGGDPELMNQNGFFFIDENKGTINFTSNLAESLITIKYISDSLGTDDEMKVHKFAEEAIYKHVAHAILSSMAQVPEYVINRFKRERRAAMRNAKLRLYDLKLPEMTQVMRGQSKHIKH